MKSLSCCVIGHKFFNATAEITEKTDRIMENLIAKNNVDTFLFGSKSRFNDFCLERITLLKKKYPFLKRVYVRAEYPDINKEYADFLAEKYEYSYFPEHIRHSGKCVYVERNAEMIDKSDFCLFYIKKDADTKSGTLIAENYALKQNKNIIYI